MIRYNNRGDVPEKYKWDLTSIFENDEVFENTYKEVVKIVDKLSTYKGCTKDSNKLYEFLKLEIDTTAIVEDLYVYSYLINDQELGIESSIVRKEKIERLLGVLNNNTSFFGPELLKLNQEEYNKLFDNTKLLEFKFNLDYIYRKKEHILSEDKEVIVNDLITSMNHFDDISSNLRNNEIDYGSIKINNEKIKIAPNNFRSLMKNKDENIRKVVYRKFNKELDKYGSTFASLLNSYVSMNDKLANIYNYKSSWDEKLFNYNISDKVYKTLVKTVESNLDSLHRYYELKSKIFNKDKLNVYDLYLDMAKSDKKYSIEEAQELVRESTKILGSDYSDRMNKIFENRYIDYCQYKGKCAGGYSFATINNDSRILMSFNDDLESVSTIAHEGGHNVNHQYLKEFNSKQYVGNASINAEVTSLLNECLLSNYIVENAKTKEEKLMGLENILGVIVSNLFGAVREGKLEEDFYKIVHKNGTITREYLDKMTKKSLKKYYGNSVKLDKYSKNGWITRSHYFMNFYLYSYAISISVASSIANKIISGDKEVLDKYIDYLKCGSNMWPEDAFNVLGVNIEDENVYLDAIKYFDSLIDKYYEILGE